MIRLYPAKRRGRAKEKRQTTLTSGSANAQRRTRSRSRGGSKSQGKDNDIITIDDSSSDEDNDSIDLSDGNDEVSCAALTLSYCISSSSLNHPRFFAARAKPKAGRDAKGQLAIDSSLMLYELPLGRESSRRNAS